MSISQGDAVPDVTVQVMKDGRPAPVSLRDLTAGKKVVLFAVPGAFTPTCSLQHLPGFVEKADEIKAKGVDEIVLYRRERRFCDGCLGTVSVGECDQHGGRWER